MDDDYFIEDKNKKVDLSCFKIGKKLGEGNFGYVNIVYSKTNNNIYAMKTIKKQNRTEQDFKKVEREVKLIKNLDNPHVVKYYTSFRENENLHIIMEYINGINLEKILYDNIKEGKLIDEKTIWNYLIQCLNGLMYLHENEKIIHRDIKPDNLIIDNDGILKIVDFGISAVKKEDVDDEIKFHNTITGPKCFMSLEMRSREEYDFKSDLYMLGISFLYIMSGKIITYYEFKNLSIKDQILGLKNKYSDNLINFITKLLETPEKRPNTKAAYTEAVIIHSNKYLKISSICSSILCLFSIPTFNSYFKSNNINLLLEHDKNNKEPKYINLKLFKNAYDNIDPLNFDNDSATNECLKLRTIMYINHEKMNFIEEIEPKEFLTDLFNNLHFELNKYNDKNKTKNNINSYDEINNNEEDEDTQNVVKNTIKKYTEEYKSIISKLFFYLEKSVYECTECSNPIKYSCIINNLCEMYPEKTTKYLNKIDINVIDLFKHYRKKRRYILNENIKCKNCEDFQKKADITKIFYISPINLILDFNYSNKDNFEFDIDEMINIDEFVERKLKKEYYLVGAIFVEEDENEECEKYASITRNEFGDWIYYDGISIKNCTFNDLGKHKKLKMLFYSSELEIK